jgi:hypothetical protein
VEEAISRFMDGLEAQERGGFNDLHSLLDLNMFCMLQGWRRNSSPS